ncbi:MAG: TIGR02646 family protein [Acidobacteriota bacterium]|nr:TIGR02646 family protein [Acidobacteriota bacterium]
MEKIERTPAPAWLEEKAAAWGKEWAEKYAAGAGSAGFTWRQHKKNGYPQLREKLITMTVGHCAFCDGFPLGERKLVFSIEHFRPKTRFPELAYEWTNLFPACLACQHKKGDSFDDQLLKPDDGDYGFDTFFQINWSNGRIEPRAGQSKSNRIRAETTIQLFGLNDGGLARVRLRELRLYQRCQDMDINEFSYRFFLKRGVISG